MIYFSLNYVVLCTRPSRPRPQLYDMDGRYHSHISSSLALSRFQDCCRILKPQGGDVIVSHEFHLLMFRVWLPFLLALAFCFAFTRPYPLFASCVAFVDLVFLHLIGLCTFCLDVGGVGACFDVGVLRPISLSPFVIFCAIFMGSVKHLPASHCFCCRCFLSHCRSASAHPPVTPSVILVASF
jgi:hypothetical protein